MRHLAALGPTTIALAACGATVAEPVAYDAFAEVEVPATFTAGEWTIVFDRAELAFGPAYFCASRAGAVAPCDVALQELLRATRLDLTVPGPQPLGEVRGTTGTIGSAAYDFGIVHPASRPVEHALPESVDGHSAYFSGIATRAGEQLAFSATLDLVPEHGSWTVAGARAEAEIEDSATTLTVTLRPEQWWQDVDFAALAGTGTVDVPAGSPAHTALVRGITGNAPPAFAWSANEED